MDGSVYPGRVTEIGLCSCSYAFKALRKLGGVKMRRITSYLPACAAILIVSAVSSCQTHSQNKPPVEQGWKPDTENADYGAYPTNYVDLIKSWYMNNLKDPDSAKFVHFSRPRKEHAITNQFNKEAMFGYSVCATVNAKNSYGGYTGGRTMWFLIRNGLIVRTQDPKHPIYIGRPTNCSDSS